MLVEVLVLFWLAGCYHLPPGASISCLECMYALRPTRLSQSVREMQHNIYSPSTEKYLQARFKTTFYLSSNEIFNVK